LIGAAAFGRKGTRAILLAAFAGAVLPDLSLYLMGGFSLYVLQIPPGIVFGQLYFSDAWQTVFAIDNSVFVWGALLGLAVWFKKPWAMALCGAALAHLALDFPLHHDDGRPHFWPLSSWIFESPVSYWDRRHGALWVAPVEAALASASAVLLWRARIGWPLSVFVLLLLGMELWIAGVWIWRFGS